MKKELTKLLVCKKNKIIFSCFFILTVVCVPARLFSQKDPSHFLAESISRAVLKKHISFLASDEMEGRENGKRGQKKAAAYLMQQFRKSGINSFGGTYFQNVPFLEIKPEKIQVAINGKQLSFATDFQHYKDFDNAEIHTEKVVFVGYGDSQSFQKAEKKFSIKGKTVFMLGGSAKTELPSITSRTRHACNLGALAVFVIDDAVGFSEETSYIREAVQAPINKTFTHSVPVLFVEKNFVDSVLREQDFLLSSWENKKSKKQKPTQFSLSIDVTAQTVDRTQKSENVFAFIQGTDLKNEIVVLLAHYDHLGKTKTQIYNGADDNASGVAALLEIAKALNLAKTKGAGFRRSVLVLLTTGEEKGLLGAKHYVNNPFFSFEQTYAALNLDMIGRSDAAHQNDAHYLYMISGNLLGEELLQIHEQVNKKYKKLPLDFKYNNKHEKQKYYYRSDHYPFAEKGIPVLFYFSGLHEDYHEPTDTAEKIDMDKVTNAAKLIFHTTWNLLNRSAPLRRN